MHARLMRLLYLRIATPEPQVYFMTLELRYENLNLY